MGLIVETSSVSAGFFEISVFMDCGCHRADRMKHGYRSQHGSRVEHALMTNCLGIEERLAQLK